MPRIYRGETVVTFRDMHFDGIDAGNAAKQFNRKRKRFEEGSDFFEVPMDQFLKLYPDDGAGCGLDRGGVFLFTMRGYLSLVSTMDDDTGWRVYKALIRHYLNSTSPAERDLGLFGPSSE